MFFNHYSRKSEIRCRTILDGPGGTFCLEFLISNFSQLLHLIAVTLSLKKAKAK